MVLYAPGVWLEGRWTLLGSHLPSPGSPQCVGQPYPGCHSYKIVFFFIHVALLSYWFPFLSFRRTVAQASGTDTGSL